ncbi:MAG: ATP-binding protein [Candidatus Omnitrophica bacterium]|nr:ATP-binding protein [Candidatus Omnitrophota bacterium]
MEIIRTPELETLKRLLKISPVVAILGPRQCGKTTLARQFIRLWKSKFTVFDLENPLDLQRLQEPLLALEELKGLVIIDEVQRCPELFPVLRVLVDRSKKVKYLILGSASKDLIKQSSESLAGRISYLEIGGFSLKHTTGKNLERLWIRGGFPRSYLASSEAASFRWRQDFIATFLERDIPQLGFKIPALSLRRFWSMLAHYQAQVFAASEIGKSLGISDHTAQRYLDLLSGTFMIRQLQPWYYNTKKRLIKRPKIYFRDSGILHALLSLEKKEDIFSHPKLGASWEGFILEEVIKHLKLRDEEVFFWGVHTGAELDIVFRKRGRLYGIEIKYAQAPSINPSMRSAFSELALKYLWVIYPGREGYLLNRKIKVLSANEIEKIQPI